MIEWEAEEEWEEELEGAVGLLPSFPCLLFFPSSFIAALRDHYTAERRPQHENTIKSACLSPRAGRRLSGSAEEFPWAR